MFNTNKELMEPLLQSDDPGNQLFNTNESKKVDSTINHQHLTDEDDENKKLSFNSMGSRKEEKRVSNRSSVDTEDDYER